MPLSETTLLKAAGEVVYGRGEDYVRYVRGLRTTASKAYASIQAKKVYTVELDWSGPSLIGSCTCPHHADGNFCKHLVATGLAAIDTGRIPIDDAADKTVEAAVQVMDIAQLRELVIALAQRDDGVRRMLEIRATAVSGDDSQVKAELEAHARKALAVRGFIDYRRSFEVAEAASLMLDELELHLDSGSAELVGPALRYAVTRLRKMIENVDDSSGSIGDQCQRAADLYARACRLGRPDPVELATWLVKFRANSPGWPHVVLADFVDCFDEQALSTYRRAVAALDRKLADRDHWQRFEVDAMLLELADHDGDVDRAVELLVQREEHPQYGAIVDRLRGAGRAEEAVAWIDRAVAEGRINSHGGGNAYWLCPDDVAATYRDLGRIDDALGVLRADFVRSPSVSTYRVLLDFAGGIGRTETERAWAFDHARQLAASDRFALGAVLVQLCLSEGDIDAAWQAADQYGPGWAWRELADRGAEARPVEAADLYRAQLEKDLRFPNTKVYPGIAAALATMAGLYERGGRSADFASFMAQIRHDYGRRSSLMKALDAERL
ncbi:SWIM zinc finger domain-containing protein [Mycolicibacterium sp.]|uniref:SWIM zinc finger domain-containing protein n=1 Tax=Mycolicibacterium sp. TaxID=2320850 RepID=UPI0037CB3BF5